MATWKKVLTVQDIDTTNTLGTDDAKVPSQLAVKTYVDAQVDTADALAEMADVTITSVTDHEVLAYDNTSSEFINMTASEAGLQTALTFGTAQGNSLKVVSPLNNDIDADDFAVFTNDHDQAGGGLKGLSAQEVRTAISAHPSGGASSLDFDAKDLTVAGNLTVSGTHITTSTETLAIADNTLILNSDLTTATDVDAGIVVERGSGVDNATFYWDEGDDRWRVGTNDEADLSSTPTYSADVMQVRIDGSAIDTSSTEVPIGHMQYHANELYLRVED